MSDTERAPDHTDTSSIEPSKSAWVVEPPMRSEPMEISASVYGSYWAPDATCVLPLTKNVVDDPDAVVARRPNARNATLPERRS